GQIGSGIFKPTDFESADTFPAPAPPGPYEARLSVFNDTDANGVWSLYVVSDQSHGAAGTLGGWNLVFATIDPIAELSVVLMESPDPVAMGSNLSYTILVTNAGPATATGVNVSDPLPAQTTFVSANSSQGSCSAQNGTVTC